MTECTTPTASFPRCIGRQITASFDGDEITPDDLLLHAFFLVTNLGKFD